MTIYVCGPMTGIPSFNFPAFNEAAATLRSMGHEVFNPAENDGGDTSRPWAYYMRKDLKQVCDSDALCLLPGWQKSKGASLEVHVARALGIPLYTLRTLSTGNASLEPLPAESALQEAQRIVHGDRGDDYGHPIHDFERTGKIWEAILGVPVPPEKVALCMIGVKISRECNKAKRDNAVDIAGYAETLSMVREEQAKRAA